MKKIFAILALGILQFPMIIFAAESLGEGGGTFPNPFGNQIESLPAFIRIIADKVILPVGAVIVVIMIIYSGFLFVTAQGNESKLGDAKKSFMYSVIGALILLGAWVIANAITGTVCLLYDNPPDGLGCP